MNLEGLFFNNLSVFIPSIAANFKASIRSFSVPVGSSSETPVCYAAWLVPGVYSLLFTQQLM